MKSCDKIQMEIYRSGDKGPTNLPVSFDEWEQRAKQKLAAGPFDYVYGAAGGGDTLKSNLEAFRKYVLRPRVCTDVSKRNLEVTLFGTKLPVPFMLAPIGVNSILHPDAETAPAKAASSSGVPYILSNVSTTPMETIARVMGDAYRWFQLYPPNSAELTQSFVSRAERAGFSAIVVTVDSTLLGWRELDLRNAYLPFLHGEGLGNYFTDPVFLEMLDRPVEEDKPGACLKALQEGNNTCFTWQKFTEIRKMTRLPVLIKGLTHPSDAVLAMEHGADGIIVSNHGGRQLDGAVAALDALPDIAQAVGGKITILFDSGIRRGADILKAIALGAQAVLIGRPFAYALAVAGESGVKEVINHLIAETELELAISGRGSISDVDETLIMKIK